MKTKTNLKLAVFGIIVVVIILAIGAFTGTEYFENKVDNKATINLSETIEINNAEMNVLFLNVGQR